MVTEGIILGHLVSTRGIEVDKSKINIISSLSNLASVISTRFSSLCLSYYRRTWTSSLTSLAWTHSKS
ncbi:hypothetical protein CR513_55917, partial [Mucuna pruriens]